MFANEKKHERQIEMMLDDEQTALANRFVNEGLDPTMSDSEKLLHVWRWLDDADLNRLSLRKQIEKLYRQHEKDIKEVENYVEHICRTSSAKIQFLEKQNAYLKEELDKATLQATADDTQLQPEPYNICDSMKAQRKNILNKEDSDGNVDNETINNAPKSSESNNNNREAENNNDRIIQQLKATIIKLENEIINLNNKLTDTNVDNRKETRQDETLLRQNAKGDKALIKKLEFDVEQLRTTLKRKEESCQEMLAASERRKQRHRDRIQRLRDHVERENRKWQQLFQAANLRKRMAQQELEMQRQNNAALEQIVN